MIVSLLNATIRAIAARAAKERSDESNQNRGRREGEDCRTVNSGLGVRDVLLRDGNESCRDLSDELTNAINQDAHTSRELKALENRVDKPDVVSCFFQYEIHLACGYTCDYRDVEQNNHEQSYGEDKVSEQLEELGKLHVAGVRYILLSANLSEELSNVTGKRVSDTVEVTHGEIVRAGNLNHEGLAQGRQSRAEESKKDTAKDHGKNHGSIMGDEDQGDYACEIQEMLSCKEDRLEGSKLGNDQVYYETENHYQSHFCSVRLKRKGPVATST